MRNWAVLIVRWVSGLLMAGHGAQKLFGWFDGPGLEGTAGWLESMGLRPGRPWAIAAGLSEFVGGLLTALGALNPLGSLGVISSMIMATATAHKGKPIWVTKGGAELPVTNAAVALGVGLAGPGRYSLDRLLGLRVPRGLLALALSGAVFAILGALANRHTS
jgi:putative oxidoreductase